MARPTIPLICTANNVADPNTGAPIVIPRDGTVVGLVLSVDATAGGTVDGTIAANQAGTVGGLTRVASGSSQVAVIPLQIPVKSGDKFYAVDLSGNSNLVNATLYLS